MEHEILYNIKNMLKKKKIKIFYKKKKISKNIYTHLYIYTHQYIFLYDIYKKIY